MKRSPSTAAAIFLLSGLAALALACAAVRSVLVGSSSRKPDVLMALIAR